MARRVKPSLRETVTFEVITTRRKGAKVEQSGPQKINVKADIVPQRAGGLNDLILGSSLKQSVTITIRRSEYQRVKDIAVPETIRARGKLWTIENEDESRYSTRSNFVDLTCTAKETSNG